MNNWKRRAPAVLAVLLLSVPSAIGVQHALAPTRGPIAAWMGAAGFEAVYLSTAILILSTDLRRYAQRIALAAVLTAVVLNTIADYAARVPGGLSTAVLAWSRFDGLALTISLVESLPLAGLSFAMASLLHRIAEQGSASLAAEAATLREQAASAGADLATTRRELAVARDRLETERAAAVQHRENAASLQDELAAEQAENRRARERLRTAEARAATPPSRTQVVAYSLAAQKTGRTRSEVAAELGYSESTLREWEKTATNGHAVEEVA